MALELPPNLHIAMCKKIIQCQTTFPMNKGYIFPITSVINMTYSQELKNQKCVEDYN
jgi:hypothetical protein